MDKFWLKPVGNVCKGPILFYTGNEGDIEWFWNNTGFLTETLSQEYQALVVFGEHRYYGKSLPFGNMSFTRENTGYFTSEQALADYAELISYLKQSLNAMSCPVIAFGGSYGGMLSAWMRMKYPQIVAGAISSSGPILEFMGTGVSQWSYYQITTETFRSADPQCPVDIRTSFDLVMDLGNTPEGRANLSTTFNTCDPLQTSSDVETLYSWMSNGFISMAMVDYPYDANFLMPLPAWPVSVSCQELAAAKKSGGLLEGVAAALSVYYNWENTIACNDLSAYGTSSLAYLPWYFQECTEMVMPISSNGTSDMFLPGYFNLDSFTTYCQNVFGITPRPLWVPLYYTGFGGKVTGTNIVFTNGVLDPWRSGGVQTSQVPSQVCLVEADAAHHLDLRTPNPLDPASVVSARDTMRDNIDQWIEEWHSNQPYLLADMIL
ncbi:lysosomal Pro-X carboxypeptidase [Pelomyxa schiedti]|nr:lysosomal Pro-X carboxypeptidase [Pelomyxa schiedti]